MDFFKSQDVARQNTGKLVILFIFAVLSIIVMANLLVMVVFGFTNTGAPLSAIQLDWEVFFAIGIGVVLVIAIGSIYKIFSLSGGGARIAEMLDGQLIVEGDRDIDKQKVLNVVQEMAIASGTPVPPVYLLDEKAINAFAAGNSPSDAVIGITRGAIKKLTRAQLQGVIAHEFSHILNGDMRLNIRLIGILHGIMIIGIIGYYILRGSGRSRNSKGKGGVIFLGLGLMVVGYAGTFFGNLIKAAVSRQREFLADASAVQFTRNPGGIGGALKRIGTMKTGALLENPSGSEISHFLFCQGFTSFFSKIFATHPPLENRITRILPNWDGNYDSVTTDKHLSSHDKQPIRTEVVDKKHVAMMAGAAVAMSKGTAFDNVGQPTKSHLEYAQKLIKDIPTILQNAASDPYAARAIIYFLVLDKNETIRSRQLVHLKASADAGVYAETIKLVDNVKELKTEHRLPLVDLALPALRQLTKPQYKLFKTNFDVLIKEDEKITVFEWSIQKVAFHHLDSVFSKKAKIVNRYTTLQKSKHACAVLLSILTYSSTQKKISDKEAFEIGKGKLNGIKVSLLEKNKIGLSILNKSLDELILLKHIQKYTLLKSCAACIAADGQITPVETELIRAIADTLGCPIPPLVVS